MMNTVERLRILRDIGERLLALSTFRGVAENIASKHSQEAQVIKWAYDEAVKKNCVKLVCVTGEPKLVSTLTALISDYLVKKKFKVTSVNDSRRYGTLAVFDHSNIASDVIHDTLQGGWISKTLTDESAWLVEPAWLICESCFTRKSQNGHETILLNCLVDKMWVADTGLETAEAEINDWLVGIRSSVSKRNV